MLKIKENIDLNELKKYGYVLGQKTMHVPYGRYGKVFHKQLDKTLIISKDIKDIVFVVQIDEDRKITLSVSTLSSFRAFWYDNHSIVEPYIQDLIQAGLVEKVEV